MKWKWDEDSVLNKYTEYTPCKDIFQAVCNEIGKYYEEKGFNYSKSRSKITYKNKFIKLEIGLWSSSYNMLGKDVTLEIIPSFFSLGLANKDKESGKKSKGYLFGYPEIFFYSIPNRKPGTVIVKRILNETIERFEEWSSESVLKIGHTCNIYGITEDDFIKIVNFIDNEIIKYIEVFEDVRKMKQFIMNSDFERINYLTKSRLKEYIEITFLEEKTGLINILENKIKCLIQNKNA
ncbi:MAG: hypothetical protein Q8936_25095 [Bacillota bacterium]|nr:hypothetical protein [Bacillota bacterium]